MLTLNLELPESWLVEPVMALHDLDNLRLADIHEQVQRLGAGWAVRQHVTRVVCTHVLRFCLCGFPCSTLSTCAQPCKLSRGATSHLAGAPLMLWCVYVLQVAYAEYELDAIMLTGSCTEFAPGKQLPPPKGLELHLGTEQQQHRVSTHHRGREGWGWGLEQGGCTAQ